MSEERAPRRAVTALCVVVVLLELLAMRATDRDYYLPDSFRPLVIGLVLLFLVVDRIRSPRFRTPALAVLFAVPAVALLLEWQAARADKKLGDSRLVRTEDDPILRFHYKPGWDTREKTPQGPLLVTDDGLWDIPHAVPKPKGTYRVVVLGDSVPNDPSVPYLSRFPKRIEALLREKGANVEIVNVSCEGFNTVQEVELLERVGLKYEPDLVVLAYVLNDPFLQDGAYRRVGNSYFLFKVGPMLRIAAGSSFCPMLAEFHKGYGFDLVVRHSLTRLKLLATQHKFGVLVATLPLVERFDDPVCRATYDLVLGIARDQGFQTVRVVDAFAGEDYHAYLKPGMENDNTHPNEKGHDRIAHAIAAAIQLPQKIE